MADTEHEVIYSEADGGYALQCQACDWTAFATVCTPTKENPEPAPDAFAQAIATRHYLSQNVWPWTEHGKPEKWDQDSGQNIILEDWPFN